VNYIYNIIISVMPDGSLYTADHEMSLQMEGLTKPRRKRGRPPKLHTEAEVCNELECNYFICIITFCLYVFLL
jgi:hypothetical protein